MSKRAEQINFKQAVYDAFGQVKDFTLAVRIARYFYEQAEKDLIEKAVTWWRNNLVESEPTKGHYISTFKKYMENK